MSKIKIITDSGSDITQKRAEELGIRLLPISFTFDGETYFREEIDMSVDEYYEKLKKSDVIPKTAQVTPIQFADAFNEEYDKGFDTLIVVTISSKGSGMYQNAFLSAGEVMDERGGEIIVLDSGAFSCLYGAAVIHAAHMLKDGKGKDEIVDYLKDAIQSMKSYFLVDDLEHLKKGGRINTATLMLANMLDIKPILSVKGGMVVQKDKLRGSKRVLKKLVANAVSDGADLSNKTVIAVYTADNAQTEELKEEIRSVFENVTFKDCRLGAVVGSHAGPALAGFVFSDKYDFTDYED